MSDLVFVRCCLLPVVSNLFCPIWFDVTWLDLTYRDLLSFFADIRTQIMTDLMQCLIFVPIASGVSISDEPNWRSSIFALSAGRYYRPSSVCARSQARSNTR